MSDYRQSSSSSESSCTKTIPQEISIPPYCLRDKSYSGGKHYAVEVRTQKWKERVKQKLKKSIENKESIELDGCTFHPSIISKPVQGKLEEASKKSYERYVRRMKMARNKKESREKEEQMRPGFGII